ncbi:MAG: family 16 glycosylhydrolase, partial [Deltaproteobacteria bacterium]|nr:family 16 glycosylhydrolase [Deltaproteobacteria bacterium]
MKKISLLSIILILGIACSDSGSDISTDLNVNKDVFSEDTYIIPDSVSDIPDAYFDNGTADSFVDVTELTDNEEKTDVYTDTMITDTGSEDAKDTGSVTDINEDLISADVQTDISPSDSGSDDIAYTDSGTEDGIVFQDIGVDNLADTGSPEDTGNYLSPPQIKLLTDSPSLETTVKIGGSAPNGSQIYFFKNKTCSAKPALILSTTTFNSSGAEIMVNAGSTTYFSAYVTDGSVYSKCSDFITFVNHNNAYWYVSFFDDFKGMESGEDPECYNMPPQCIGEYITGLYECPAQEVHSGLSALNKCKWTILRQPNWMAMEYGQNKNGTNGFTPLEVSVEPNTDNGVLILSANAYKWDGTKLNPSKLTTNEKICLQQPQSNWLLHENNSPDCRNIVNYNCIWANGTVNCPVMAGAVYSKKFSTYKIGNTDVKKERGFIQEYGRWEVRAKLPSGMGSFPANWLLPQSGSWPERGEIDIMEADRYAKESYQTYHTGY